MIQGTYVVVLTPYHKDVHIFPAIKEGALSYLLKDVGTEELAETLRRQHAARRLCIPAWRRVSCRNCAGRARKCPTPAWS